MSSGNWRPFCLGLNVLRFNGRHYCLFSFSLFCTTISDKCWCIIATHYHFHATSSYIILFAKNQRAHLDHRTGILVHFRRFSSHADSSMVVFERETSAHEVRLITTDCKIYFTYSNGLPCCYRCINWVAWKLVLFLLRFDGCNLYVKK